MLVNRLVIAQFVLAGAAVLLALAILTFMFGPLVLGVLCLVAEHAAAAVACALYADSKGYPAWIGVPLGVGLGAVGWAAIAVLPDESQECVRAPERKVSPAALKNARRDPGYEVLEDDD